MARAPFGRWNATAITPSWSGGGRVAGGGGMGLNISVDGRPESDLALAFQGALEETIEDERHRVVTAYHRAMTRFVDAGKAKLRADIVSGGFYRAERLSKTWRGQVFPKLPRSFDVAGWFSSKARVIIEAFEEGVTIRARDGNYLAVPLGPAKAILRRLNAFKARSARDSGVGRDAFGRYVKDENPLARVAQALGVTLKPIINPATGVGVIVADSGLRVTRTGREAKSQRGQATPLFALVRQATLKRRIRGQAVLDEIRDSFPGEFVALLAQELGPEETA